MDTTGTILLPPPASTIAGEVDSLFYFLYYLSVFFCVLIYGITTYFVIKYRRKGKRDQLTSGPDQNHKLEMVWTLVPTLIVLVIFVWGFKTYLKMNVVPANAMEVKVTGQKWFWTFEYPNGAITTNELVAPVGRPVKLLISAKDVLHSFFVPEFRLKLDAIPNRYTITWFEANYVGEFHIFCTEYCGEGHSAMTGKVRIISQEEFPTWLESQADDLDMSPEERGAKLYTTRACNTCHSLDGAKSVGPTFQGLFGRVEDLTDGSNLIVDENYIRESLLNPQKQIVKGYQPVMPTYQGILKDRDIDAIIAYLKTVR